MHKLRSIEPEQGKAVQVKQAELKQVQIARHNNMVENISINSISRFFISTYHILYKKNTLQRNRSRRTVYE